MADSTSSTSQNPQIDNLGPTELSIPNTTPSVSISTDQIHHSKSPQNDAPDDTTEEFRDAIERELSQLTIQQAQIERLEQISAVHGDDGDGDGDEGDNNLGDEESVVEDYDNKDDGNVDGKITTNVEELTYNNNINNNNNNQRRRINYPMGPDAEDCGYYMKFGSCKFGVNCKFNHPPRRKNHQGFKERLDHREDNSQRAGQTECKYYLTSGRCKYGNDCKFSHGSDKISTSHVSELNFLGLPIRTGEKECPFYMRTGSCKYGSSCRFHHPDPTTVNGGGDPLSGYGNDGSLPSKLVSSSPVSSWSSPRAFNGASPFVPAMFPPTQAAPASSSEWNGYQAAAYSKSERSLPIPPAFAMNNLPPEINFSMPYHPHNLIFEEYPERPGEPECSFFLKTGDCKFKSNCRFHHPRNHTSKPKAITYALNDKGLPLRPDQAICTYYQRYGICKYGPACKYDHPSQFAIPFDRLAT